MSLTLIGKKCGMTRVFDSKSGKVTPCTVIEVQPNIVSQVKTVETDGYSAVQIAGLPVSESKKKSLTKPELGHFTSKKINPYRRLRESRVEDLGDMEVGKEIAVDYFQEGKLVDVSGISKGKGYQGKIKRHNHSRICKSHGAGPNVRRGGSIGGTSTSHGETAKGTKMAGQMGSERSTVERLEVMKVDADLNVMLVKGAVPGSNGTEVYLRKTLKEKV